LRGPKERRRKPIIKGRERGRKGKERGGRRGSGKRRRCAVGIFGNPPKSGPKFLYTIYKPYTASRNRVMVKGYG